MTAKEIFQLADQYCDSAALQQAHAAGLFELLQSPMSAAEVAAETRWLPWKAAVFLDALASLSLLVKADGRYCNSEAASEALVKASSSYIGDLIEHERLQWNLWGRLDEVLHSRDPVDGQQDLVLPESATANAVFHRAMMQLADELIELVVSLPEWEGVRHVLDLAGGHGRYLGELATRRATLTGEVWDLSSARPHAEATLASLDVADRVNFSERDITKANSYVDVRADAVMLNHCLHHFPIEAVDRVVANVASVLPVGGLLTVLDAHLEAGRTSPPENAMFSLYMMVNTASGRVHPTSEVATVLERRGFSVDTRLLNSLEDDYIMVARKR